MSTLYQFCNRRREPHQPPLYGGRRRRHQIPCLVNRKFATTSPAAKDAIQLPESNLKPLSTPKFIESQTLFYKSAASNRDPTKSISADIALKLQFLTKIVQFLKSDDISRKERKSALKIIIAVCIWGRNQVKAVEAGVVVAAVDLLLETSEMLMAGWTCSASARTGGRS